MLTIEGSQNAFLNSNSLNLLHYQFKNQFPLFKLLRRNKLNNGRSKNIFLPRIFLWKDLIITYYHEKNFAIMKECKKLKENLQSFSLFLKQTLVRRFKCDKLAK